MGAVALQQVGDPDAEGQRALVDKGEGQVGHTSLVSPVLLGGGVGLPGHFPHGKTADTPHLANSESHFHQLTVDMGCVHG